MADMAIVGGGVVGLATSMLLANDGHQVVVLERDGSGPPGDPVGAWVDWECKGVGQFRLLHFLLPRFRTVIAAELPELVGA